MTSFNYLSPFPQNQMWSDNKKKKNQAIFRSVLAISVSALIDNNNNHAKLALQILVRSAPKQCQYSAINSERFAVTKCWTYYTSPVALNKSQGTKIMRPETNFAWLPIKMCFKLLKIPTDTVSVRIEAY